jgi:hypothetical protein
MRRIRDVEGELRALGRADVCWLFGNAHTLATYRPEVRAKTLLLHPSGALLRQGGGSRPAGEERRWLWFAGLGAVLKGLDRTVEAFLGRPDWRLDIVGPASDEPWFRQAYGARIEAAGNIMMHGTLRPISYEFFEITRRCTGFVAPSASEGMSTAVITCLQAGLYPVIARDCGVDLPEGYGSVLETGAAAEIEAAIAAVHAMPVATRLAQCRRLAADAEDRFSRMRFLQSVDRLLDAAGCQGTSPGPEGGQVDAGLAADDRGEAGGRGPSASRRMSSALLAMWRRT